MLKVETIRETAPNLQIKLRLLKVNRTQQSLFRGNIPVNHRPGRAAEKSERIPG